MTEEQRPDEQKQFETDTVDANRAEQQGLGVGARELQAQREPGETVDSEQDQDDATTMERDTAVQGRQEQQAPEA